MTCPKPTPHSPLIEEGVGQSAPFLSAPGWWYWLALLLAVLAYLLTAAGPLLMVEAAALAGLFFLRWQPGLFLTILAIPFSYAYKQVGPALISPADVLVWTTFLGWALRRCSQARHLAPTHIRSLRLSSLDWAIIALVATGFLSLLASEDKMAWLWEMRLVVVQPALLYLLVRSRSLGKTWLPMLGDALILASVAASAVGLYDYFVLGYVERAEGVRRLLSAYYDSPNHLSLFLGRVVPIAVCMSAFGEKRARRIARGMALLPMLLCIYLTYSRGAWLVGLPASLLFIGMMRGRRATLLALGLLLVGAVALLPVMATSRFESLFRPGSGTSMLRILLWTGTLRMIGAHPLWGVGLGNFQRQYLRYMLPEAWREPNLYHPHNLVLDFWAVLGIPGVIALIWMVAAFYGLAVRLYRRLGEPESRALVLGLMASMVNFLAHGLVDTTYFLADLALVFMLTLGIVSRLNRIGADQEGLARL